MGIKLIHSSFHLEKIQEEEKFQKQPFKDVLQTFWKISYKAFLKISKISRKTFVLDSLFNKIAGLKDLKRDSSTDAYL